MKSLTIAGPTTVPTLTEQVPPHSSGHLAAVDIRAAALTNLDIAVAEGRHYFSSNVWPRGIGREAVAITHGGNRVFLTAPSIQAPFGSLSERSLANLDLALPVLDELPDELAAAIGNPGLAAWLALSWRALVGRGETVLVLGATGTSGRIAVAAAKLLGAGHVVAAGRNQELLKDVRHMGADAVVQLASSEDLPEIMMDATNGGADVVIDFLNGRAAEAALGAMRLHGRMVQVGSTVAPETMVHAQTARRFSLDVLGFAYYHAPIAEQIAAYRRLALAALAGEVDIDFSVHSLDDAVHAWDLQKSGACRRQVIRPH